MAVFNTISILLTFFNVSLYLKRGMSSYVLTNPCKPCVVSAATCPTLDSRGCFPSCLSTIPSETPPVDPVSLALALQAPSPCIREDKLQFGPNRLPLDGRIIKCANNIPEGGLDTLCRQIMELKPISPQKTLAEEAAESYLDNCCCNINACNKPCLTYTDLGFVPEQPKCPQFCLGAPPPVKLPGTVMYDGSAASTCATLSTCPTLPSYPTVPNCVPQCSACSGLPTPQTNPLAYSNCANCLATAGLPAVSSCASCSFQPGGVYMTQNSCTKGACTPELYR